MLENWKFTWGFECVSLRISDKTFVLFEEQG